MVQVQRVGGVGVRGGLVRGSAQRRRGPGLRVTSAILTAAVSAWAGSIASGQTFLLRAGGDWTNPANWAGGALPSSTSNPVIPEGIANTGATTASAITFTTTGFTTSLTQLTIDTASAWNIPGTGTISFAGSTPGAGLTIDARRSARVMPETGGATTVVYPTRLGATLVGSGGLTKTGPGSLFLGSATAGVSNAFTGGVTVKEGTLMPVNMDLSFGAQGPGNDITLDGGGISFLILVASNFTTSRGINVGPNGGFIQPRATTGMNFNGTVAGTGTLTLERFSSSAISAVFTGSNTTFTGTLRTRTLNAGSVVLNSTGSFTSALALDLASPMVLDNTVTQISRLNAAGTLRLRGSTEFRITNSATGASITEAIGTLTASGGSPTLRLQSISSGTGDMTLTAGSLTRDKKGTLFVAGTLLGSTPAAGVANLVVTGDLSGELRGAAAGTGTSTPVIPWLVGSQSSGASASSSSNTISLMTWNSATGRLAPVATTGGYITNTFAGSTADTNVRITGAVTDDAAVSVNGLSLVSATVTGTGTLTINSGAIVATTSETGLSKPIDFQNHEGILHAYTTVVASSTFSGTAGFTKAGPGTFRAVGNGNSSTYTGQTTLLGGPIEFSGDVLKGQPSAFGAGTDEEIVLAAGAGVTEFRPQSPTATISRDIRILGPGTGSVWLGNTTTTVNISPTFSGKITLDGKELSLSFGATGTGSFTGKITGDGAIRDAAPATPLTTVFLSGNNDFSGGVVGFGGRWIAGSDTAFGTGGFYSGIATSAPTVVATGGTSRTLANEFIMSFAGLTFLTTADSIPITLSGSLDPNGFSRTVTVTGTTPVTVTGAVKAGGIVKDGIGTLTLAGATSDLTQLNVTNGLVRIGTGGTNGSVGSLTNVVAASGTLTFNRSDNLTVAGTLSGAGTVNHDGAATTTFGGAFTVSGTVNLNAGTVLLSSGTSAALFTGPGSLGKVGTGTSTLNNANSSYSGETFINAGILQLAGALPVSGNSVAGNAASALRIEPTTATRAAIWINSSTVDRAIVVQGAGTGTAGLGNIAGTDSPTFNGDITLNRELRLEFTANGVGTFNGKFTGPGGLTDGASATALSAQILNGSSSFSGGIRLANGQYVAGNDAAFGTGTVTSTNIYTGNGTIAATGGTRTLANNFVLRNSIAFGSSRGTDNIAITGSLNVDSVARNVTVQNGITLTLAGDVTGAGALIKLGDGTLAYTGSQKTHTGNLIVNAGALVSGVPLVNPTGTLSVTSLANLNPAPTPKAAAGYSIAADYGTVSVGGNGTIAVAQHDRAVNKAPVVVASGLSIAPAGFLDLGTGDLIARAADLTTVRAAVSNWFNGDTAAARLGSTGPGAGLGAASTTTLAVFPNVTTGGAAYYDKYDGVTLSAADLIVKYTYLGDTNVDGVLDAADYVKILEGLTTAATGWQNGDVNYDGTVNATDLSLFLTVFGQTGLPSLGNGSGDASSGTGGSIPEPTSAALLLAATPLLTRRRR